MKLGKEEEENEEYEVEYVQLYGVKFWKGRDDGICIDAIGADGSADKSGMLTVGDKVLATRCISLLHSLSLLLVVFSFYE